jgi:hypothetical protein
VPNKAIFAMAPVKVNIFISHAPEDKPAADRLAEWLYPMRDEVNVWHYDPPRRPSPLSLSWKILLPWYRVIDPRVLYAETVKNRRENAHIYVFLTSFKSLANRQVEEDITVAISRRVDCLWEDLAPLVLPVLLSPSRWKEESRLSEFEAMAGGMPLNQFPVVDDGYLKVSEQLAALVKVVQVRLNEAKYYLQDPTHANEARALMATPQGLPYLGENPSMFEFKPPPAFNPPDWAGWTLIGLLFTLAMAGFSGRDRAVEDLHLKYGVDKEFQIEFKREVPLSPPPDSMKIVFPPVE